MKLFFQNILLRASHERSQGFTPSEALTMHSSEALTMHSSEALTMHPSETLTMHPSETLTFRITGLCFFAAINWSKTHEFGQCYKKEQLNFRNGYPARPTNTTVRPGAKPAFYP